MAFSKKDLQTELREFMLGYARSVERLFNNRCGGYMVGCGGREIWDVEPKDVQVEESWLWKTAMGMYDYGVLGGRAEGKIHQIDGPEEDVQLFLWAINSDGMKLYFEEDEVRWPRLTNRTVRMAIARHVLDGEDRVIFREDEENGHLSFSELALLADMEETSVRNAANSKLPSPLVTKNFGKRTLIAVEDARRWLTGRKGFVPTQNYTPLSTPPEANWTQQGMPLEVSARLQELAVDAKVPSWEFLSQLLEKHEREIAARDGQLEKGVGGSSADANPKSGALGAGQ